MSQTWLGCPNKMHPLTDELTVAVHVGTDPRFIVNDEKLGGRLSSVLWGP